MVHENFKFNVLVQIGNLEVRIIEHIQALVESADADDSICSKVWNALLLPLVQLSLMLMLESVLTKLPLRWWPETIEVLLLKHGLNLLISQIQPWQRLLLSLGLLS